MWKRRIKGCKALDDGRFDGDGEAEIVRPAPLELDFSRHPLLNKDIHTNKPSVPWHPICDTTLTFLKRRRSVRYLCSIIAGLDDITLLHPHNTISLASWPILGGIVYDSFSNSVACKRHGVGNQDSPI